MRVFVALDVPEHVRAALAELSARLRKTYPSARWVRLAGVHITLKFIGEVPPEKLEKIRLTLGDLPSFPPIKLRFAGLGFFPNARRPRVLWAGVEAGPQLAALAAAIETKLSSLSAFPPKIANSIRISRSRALILPKAPTPCAPPSKLSERPNLAAQSSRSFTCIKAC